MEFLFVLFLIGILCFLFFSLRSANKSRRETLNVNYSKIFDVVGSSNDEMFSRIKLWAVNCFSKKTAIEYSDKKLGIISGKYTGIEHFNLGGCRAVESRFTIHIEGEKLKFDLKPIRIVAYRFSKSGRRYEMSSSSVFGVEEADIVAEYDALFESLKQHLLSKDTGW